MHRQVASIISAKKVLKSLLLFSDEWSPKGIACLAIVEAREYLAIVLRQVASINWAIKYYPNRFRFFSDRWLPKVIACLAIGCRKIASKDLAIRHSQNHKRLFSKFLSPNCHRLFSDKRVQHFQIYLAIISSRSPVIISDINMPNGLRSFSNADDVMMTSSSQKLGDMGYVPKST